MTLKKLNLTVAGSAIGATAIFLGALVIPGTKKLNAQRTAVKEQLIAVQQEQQAIGNVADVYASLVELTNRNRDFRKKLPVERQFGEFLQALSDTMNRHGIEEGAVQQKAELQVDATALPTHLALIKGTGILPVEVGFDATFQQLFDFLSGVQALPRLSHVESLKITNDEQSPGRIHAELVLHTYYRPDTEKSNVQ
ncbi:MAG: type 4a pilus biogenesis protein PilO [Planctomycetes bacterium]|nr:type 4a pilus biogenesis protein PilO [Planctomycetota bacterium]